MKPREPRRKVLVKARMRLDGAWGDVCIRDISSRGLLLQGALPPPRGTYIEVFRGRHIIVARVVWTKDRSFGVQAQDRINIDAVVGEPDLSGIDYAAAVKAQPGFDRRRSPRETEARIAERAQRSRSLSAAMEFGFMAALILFAATAAFSVITDTLARPAAALRGALGEQ